MRLLITAALLVAGAPARAQPVTQPEPRAEPDYRAEICGVTFVRAPDDVRYVIEQWIRAEPRCASTLELRVIPTGGGIYLMAQRPDGRIHERLVPDAQSAGVLVASWVADEWTMAQPPPGEMLAAAPPTETVTVTDDPVVAAPCGSTGVSETAPQRRARKPGRWLSVGMQYGSADINVGFRGELEVFRIGGFKLGATISYTNQRQSVVPVQAGWQPGYLKLDDLGVLATISRAWHTGRWELRAGAGLGMVSSSGIAVRQTSSEPDANWMEQPAVGTSPIAELSLLATLRFGASWGLGVGPVMTYIDQTFIGAAAPSTKSERETPTTMIFGGLRYEL